MFNRCSQATVYLFLFTCQFDDAFWSLLNVVSPVYSNVLNCVLSYTPIFFHQVRLLLGDLLYKSNYVAFSIVIRIKQNNLFYKPSGIHSSIMLHMAINGVHVIHSNTEDMLCMLLHNNNSRSSGNNLNIQ